MIWILNLCIHFYSICTIIGGAITDVLGLPELHVLLGQVIDLRLKLSDFGLVMGEHQFHSFGQPS